MGSDMVVFFDPAIDCGLGLAGGSEPVCVFGAMNHVALRKSMHLDPRHDPRFST